MSNENDKVHALGAKILFRATEVTMTTVSKFSQLEIAIMMLIFDSLADPELAEIDTVTFVSALFSPEGLEKLTLDLQKNNVECEKEEVGKVLIRVISSLIESGLMFHVGMAATGGIDINPPKKSKKESKFNKFEDLGIEDPFKSKE